MVYGGMNCPESWFSFVEKINQQYCSIHDYHYTVDRRENIREDRHGHWTKVESIMTHLNDCDFLLFLDADVCAYSHVLSIEEELLPILANYEILTPIDCGGEQYRWRPDCSNVGIMLIRNSPHAHQIIADWNTMTEIEKYGYTKWTFPLEQLGFREYICEKYRDAIRVFLDYYVLQSKYGQFFRHIFGCSGIDRQEFKQIWESPLMERNRRLKK